MKASIAFAFFLLFLAGIALSNLGRLQSRQTAELRPPLATELTSRSWRLAAMRGAGSAASSRIELLFSRAGLLSITGACNHYTADYELDGDALAIAALKGTRRACDPETMTEDDTFVGILDNTARAATDGRQLVLLSADGERLARFAASAER